MSLSVRLLVREGHERDWAWPHQLNLLLQIDAQLPVVRHGGLIGNVVAAYCGAQVLQRRALLRGDLSFPVQRAERDPQGPSDGGGDRRSECAVPDLDL